MILEPIQQLLQLSEWRGRHTGLMAISAVISSVMEVKKMQNVKAFFQPRAKLMISWCVVGRTKRTRKRRARSFWPCCNLASRTHIREYGMPSSTRSGRWPWHSRSVRIVQHRTALGTGLNQRSTTGGRFPRISSRCQSASSVLGILLPRTACSVSKRLESGQPHRGHLQRSQPGSCTGVGAEVSLPTYET